MKFFLLSRKVSDKDKRKDKKKSCYNCEYFEPEIKLCSFVDMRVCFPEVGCSDYKKKES